MSDYDPHTSLEPMVKSPMVLGSIENHTGLDNSPTFPAGQKWGFDALD